VQLHQLTPNSLLHIACFVTLCEPFLGIEPHFLLWRSLFWLRPSVSLSNKPELGGAVISVHAEAQYLEFSMAASVQGWRTKWFYIKDHKASSDDEYGLAPFDASKELKKLTSWDSPPTDAEMEEIAPLLTRIQTLKGDRGGALSGTQLMAFFVQRRVQPLQHRLSNLWNFSSLGDSSRVSEDLMEKQDADRRVRALPSSPRIMQLRIWPLIILTPSTPCPRYVLFVYRFLSFPSSSYCLSSYLDDFTDLLIYRTTGSLFHALPF
jgi:hypothetical protein